MRIVFYQPLVSTVSCYTKYVLFRSAIESMKPDQFIQTRAHCILIFCQSFVTMHQVIGLRLLHLRISCEKSLSDTCPLCGLNIIPTVAAEHALHW